jgi:hypothetical protein
MSDILATIEKKLAESPTGDVSLTPKQAAEYLPFTYYHVIDRIKAGEFGSYEENPDAPTRNRYWVYLSEIRDWLKARQSKKSV